MSVKLLTEHNFEFLSFKGCCTGSSESTLVKMPHCWKSHFAAKMALYDEEILKELKQEILKFMNIKSNETDANMGSAQKKDANLGETAHINNTETELMEALDE